MKKLILLLLRCLMLTACEAPSDPTALETSTPTDPAPTDVTELSAESETTSPTEGPTEPEPTTITISITVTTITTVLKPLRCRLRKST